MALLCNAVMDKMIYLRASGVFLAQDGTWTPHIGLAKKFPDTTNAYAEARYLAMTGLDIYYAFDSTRRTEWDFCVPLEDPLVPGPKGRSPKRPSSKLPENPGGRSD